MEKLEGESLKARIKGKPMDLEHLLDIALQVADALALLMPRGLSIAISSRRIFF